MTGRSRDRTLLNALLLAVPANERVEDGEDMAPVFKHAGKNVAQPRLALGFAVPLGKNRGRDLDVLAQFVRGMPPQEQTVEKCRLALRILQIHSNFGRQVRGHGRHRKSAVYRK